VNKEELQSIYAENLLNNKNCSNCKFYILEKDRCINQKNNPNYQWPFADELHFINNVRTCSNWEQK
jgi:hypothetical protein